MTKVNKGDLFIVEFISLIEKVSLDGWNMTLRVTNLGVDTGYFDQSLKNCYAENANGKVEGNLLKFEFLAEPDDIETFCEGVAEEILDELSRHSEWGKEGGPDQVDDYSKLK